MEDVGNVARLQPFRGGVALVFEVKIDHWVVNKTLSNARKVNDGSNAMLLQLVGRTDSRELENLRKTRIKREECIDEAYIRGVNAQRRLWIYCVKTYFTMTKSDVRHNDLFLCPDLPGLLAFCSTKLDADRPWFPCRGRSLEEDARGSRIDRNSKVRAREHIWRQVRRFGRHAPVLLVDVGH